jgi:hypothetical protein
MRARGNRAGVTLIESLLSIVLLALTVGGVSALFSSGLLALDQGEQVMLLESAMRSQMETLISRPFGEVLFEGSGEEIVSVGGVDHKIAWSASGTDLDADGAPEANAMLVQVSLEGRSLSVILVDHAGRLREAP